MKKSKSVSLLKLPAILAITGLTSSIATAMPSYNRETAISKIDSGLYANDSVLKTAQVFGDHLDNMRLYVSPSNKKVQTGVFGISATPACEILKNQYYLTYMVPSTAHSTWLVQARKGPFSGFFDFSLGNYIRNTDIIEEMRQKVAKIQSYRDQHPAIVAEYEAAKKAAELKVTESDKAQRDYDRYPSQIKELTGFLIAAAGDAELLAAYKEQLTATRDEFKVQAPRLIKAIASASKALREADDRLAEAQGAYNEAIPDEKAINDRITTLTGLFDTIQKSAKQVYDDNNKILLALESTAVGTASASYSIWGDESARLKQVVSGSGLDFNVYNLPIYDIRMNPVQSLNIPSSITSDDPTIASLNNAGSLALVNEATAPISNGTDKNITSFENESGQLIETKIATLSEEGASRTFQNIVTRGAFCTGNSERAFQDVAIAVPDEGHHTANYDIEYATYSARKLPVLAQSVSISYKYNIKNEPVDVSCVLDTTKFTSWVSKKKTSGFLFWRKKKSSEDRQMLQENGLFCSASTNTFGDDKTKERADQIIDEMTKEIAAEYILQYAKSYEVVTYKESELPDPGKAAEKMGTAMQTLCSGNVYCEVGSIVLKTGAELFGSVSGSSSGSETITGKITRRYSEHAYTSLPATAVVDLTVNL